MKYALPPQTVDRDFAHELPAPAPTFGRYIFGIAVFVGCMSWPMLILSMEAIR